MAAFNIKGNTLHSLLSLPVRGDFKELQRERLHEIQQTLASMDYLIIDEMSMVGRKFLGHVLRQVFPPSSRHSVWRMLLLGQLPPVMDLPPTPHVLHCLIKAFQQCHHLTASDASNQVLCLRDAQLTVSNSDEKDTSPSRRLSTIHRCPPSSSYDRGCSGAQYFVTQ